MLRVDLVSVERISGQRPLTRCATDLAERGKAQVPVERTVFGAFRHHRAAQLFPAGGNRWSAAYLVDERGQFADEIGSTIRRPLECGVEFADRCRVIGKVRPIPVHPDRELDDRCAESFDVASPGHRDQAYQPVEVGAETTGDRLASRLVLDLFESPGVASEVVPQLGQRVLCRRIEQCMLGDADVFVARGAVDRPRGRQRLTDRKDLLDEQPSVCADAAAKTVQVRLRMCQTIDMVDANAGECRMRRQPCRDRVDHLGNGWLFRANSDEVVDREEATNVSGGIAPPLQPVVLTADGLGDVQVLRSRRQGKTQWSVPQFRAPVSLADRQFAPRDHHLERIAELGQDDAPIALVPLDVEPVGSLRAATVAKHLPPSGVQGGVRDGHVVRHVIDDDTEAPFQRRIEQVDQRRFTAELCANLRVVGDVVSVQAPRDRLGDRREVEVAHPERHEVVEQSACIGETERRRELDPV